jgi:hypothetical protein
MLFSFDSLSHALTTRIESAAAARRRQFGRTRLQMGRTSFGSLADAVRNPKIGASRLGRMLRKPNRELSNVISLHFRHDRV